MMPGACGAPPRRRRVLAKSCGQQARAQQRAFIAEAQLAARKMTKIAVKISHLAQKRKFLILLPAGQFERPASVNG